MDATLKAVEQGRALGLNVHWVRYVTSDSLVCCLTHVCLHLCDPLTSDSIFDLDSCCLTQSFDSCLTLSRTFSSCRLICDGPAWVWSIRRMTHQVPRCHTTVSDCGDALPLTCSSSPLTQLLFVSITHRQSLGSLKYLC
jgi:hypothetical protein